MQNLPAIQKGFRIAAPIQASSETWAIYKIPIRRSFPGCEGAIA